MIERGNRPGLIREWLNGVRQWAETHQGVDATALRSWLKMVQPKPFYSAHELAVMWPGLKMATGLATRMMPAPSPDRLRRELEFCGLPYLGGGAFYSSPFRPAGKFFIVEQIGRWRQTIPTQEEFEKVMYGT